MIIIIAHSLVLNATEQTVSEYWGQLLCAAWLWWPIVNWHTASCRHLPVPGVNLQQILIMHSYLSGFLLYCFVYRVWCIERYECLTACDGNMIWSYEVCH